MIEGTDLYSELNAAFALIQDSVLDIISRAAEEGWSEIHLDAVLQDLLIGKEEIENA